MTFRLTRRRFLFLGVTAGVAALGVAAVWPDSAVLDDDPSVYHVLTTRDRAILAALAPAMLAGAWPTVPEAATAETQALLRGMDAALRGLPPRTRDELRQLLDLLGRQGGRVVLAGSLVGWAVVDPARATAILTGWRDHTLALLQQAYGGLHDLMVGVWYGDPRHWADCGYPGPPILRLTS